LPLANRLLLILTAAIQAYAAVSLCALASVERLKDARLDRSGKRKDVRLALLHAGLKLSYFISSISKPSLRGLFFSFSISV
jgi:hypothetical protein